MAGSYGHLTGDGGWSMIENMGDAYECVEELFWLVESQIGQARAEQTLNEFYAMKRGETKPDVAMQIVSQQMGK